VDRNQGETEAGAAFLLISDSVLVTQNSTTLNPPDLGEPEVVVGDAGAGGLWPPVIS
jgi:hypothetical protein